LVVLGFELRASGRCSCDTPPASFSGYFEDRALLYSHADLKHDLPIYSSCNSWDDRCVPSQLFSFEIGSKELFLSELNWNHTCSDFSLPHNLWWQAWATGPWLLKRVFTACVGGHSLPFSLQYHHSLQVLLLCPVSHMAWHKKYEPWYK
jgi:hypothetical protein